MNDNPYASPAVSVDVVAASLPDPSLSTIAKGVFLSWEKLRVAYLAVLVVVTMLLMGPRIIAGPGLVLRLLEGAVIANLLYFAGPVLETYVRWLGYNHSWPRWLMFICGTALSVILTVGVLTELLPNLK